MQENEVYGIDIVVSTGEGKSKVTDEKETTVSALIDLGVGCLLLLDLLMKSVVLQESPCKQ